MHISPPVSDKPGEVQDMFQKLVRANAVITGEELPSWMLRGSENMLSRATLQDKGLDETTLLTNAANNLRHPLGM